MGPLARRPLTEIELRLVSRITGLFLEELRHAWENVLELKLTVLQVESNPQLVQIVPPNEVVVVISFELTIGDLRGHDEPLHPLQLDRADRRQALGQQLGLLRPRKRLAGDDPADQRDALQLAGRRVTSGWRRRRSAPAS